MQPRFCMGVSRLSVVVASFCLAACGGGGSGGSDSTPTPPVTPTNSAPLIASANTNQSASVGSAFNYDAGQGGTSFSDPDGDTLTYTIIFSPDANGLTASGVAISGTPGSAGTTTVAVTATDPDGLAITDTFDIVFSEPAQLATNILLIIADDLGIDSSAQYDLTADKPSTPFLNQMAADGLVFENLWVNPVCSPTRSSLLTGKYGLRTGVLSPGDEHDVSETTVFEKLKEDQLTSAYSAGMIGKWHLGGGVTGPNDAGIDHFEGIVGGGVQDYMSWTLNVNGSNSQSNNYSTTEITDRAITWSGQQANPWFMWVAYNAPHTPFHLPPADLHERNLSGDAADINANPRPYYLAAIEAMDAEIGRLVASMDSDVLANTTIIFIGDNGTPGQVKDQAALQNGAKGSVYEGGVRVPMIVSGKGVTRQGEREASLINGADFYTAILQLAGQSGNAIHDSRSFVPLLTDSTASKRVNVYSENVDSYALRGERYKLITDSDGSQEFYDLLSDPAESDNLIGTNSGLESVIAEFESEVNSIRNGGWLVNQSSEQSPYLVDSGDFVEVNVLSVIDDGTSVTVTTNGVPNYTVSITDEVLDVYQSRPATAFTAGPVLNVGDVVEWGQNVGFTSNCAGSGSDGWSPVGGADCPRSQLGLSVSVPSVPTPASGECETGLGPVGLWANGVPIYNWSDASSHDDEGFWHRFAEPYRSAGMDLCNGHAGGQGGQYHHHSYNACLGQMVSDNKNRHSPIYGYAGDGYAIHGPYHSDGQLTQSCWKIRNYSAGSDTGCGVDGARTCKLVNEEDITEGVESIQAGPATDDIIGFFQNGDGAAMAGIFYEDFYYDAACTDQGEEFLDEHNGHDHDSRGYHYHTSVDAELKPTFPLVHGPDYYGNVSQGSFRCFGTNF